MLRLILRRRGLLRKEEEKEKVERDNLRDWQNRWIIRELALSVASCNITAVSVVRWQPQESEEDNEIFVGGARVDSEVNSVEEWQKLAKGVDLPDPGLCEVIEVKK